MTSAAAPTALMNAIIAALFVYPVKSCRGIAVSSAMVTERGLAYDREWMIVDGTGRFVTQRDEPQLALIATALRSSTLELTTPRKEALVVPLVAAGGAQCHVTVWRDTVPAIDEGDNAAAWLSSSLGRELRLVRFEPTVRRHCDPSFAGDSGAHTAFADAYPLLVLSEASLADLNRRLDWLLPIDRFRPNVVLTGVDAYDEDYIDELIADKASFRLVKPCARCQITTTDQATATVGVEPLATLSHYRMNISLGGVTFGMNGIVTGGAGEIIRVGATAHCSLRF